MARIDDFPVLDFSGGVRRDKSNFALRRNELIDARNLEIAEQGRLRVRRGSHQVGDSLSGDVENIFSFIRYSTSGVAQVRTIANTNDQTSVLSTLTSTRLTADVATSDTTITVSTNTNTPDSFDLSGTIEIDGDIITYTGIPTGTTFTGVTGINSPHLAGASVHQWHTLAQSGTAMDGRLGITSAIINNILIMAGRGGNMKQYDGSNVTDVSGEPAIINLVNYRDRLYGMGDASTGTNASSRRVSFSNRGDGTTWTTASDFFDLEDQRGQAVTAFKVFNDVLGIFKTSSIFTYDEVELKQRVSNVGAYNDKVIQQIGTSLFTFCPEGIFETNLFSARQIGEPVREYWKNFFPVYDTVSNRVCTNTFSWQWEGRYFVFLGNVTEPSIGTSVVLEYDTSSKNWMVHNGGFTNWLVANNFQQFQFGDWFNKALNIHSALFAGDSGGKVWRVFENHYQDGATPPAVHGGDIFQDLVSNTGSVISAFAEFPLYDLSYPSLFKTFKSLRVYAETGQWAFEYRTEDESGVVSEYKPLGVTTKRNQVLPFPADAQGFRVGLRVSSVSPNQTSILNGFVFEKTEVRPRT